MRLPRYQDKPKFHDAVESALKTFAKKYNIPNWPPTEKGNSPSRGLICRKLFDTKGKDRWHLMQTYENRLLKNQPPTYHFGITIWITLKDLDKDILKQACIEHDIAFITYPSQEECYLFYDFYQCNKKRRLDVKRALCGRYRGYRPFWMPTKDNTTPILQFQLSIKSHKDDESCLVAKETISYPHPSKPGEYVTESSYGILVIDEQFVHLYLKAEKQRRHKHYVLTVNDENLTSSNPITLACGTCMIASYKGPVVDASYITGRGVVILRIDDGTERLEHNLPSIKHLSELDQDIAQRLEYFDGGYFTEWEDLPTNSVNRALASKIIAESKKINKSLKELDILANIIDKH